MIDFSNNGKNGKSSKIKKILITGNMGYVGPNVVARLRKTHPSAKLIGLDAGYFAHCLTHKGLLPETRVDTQHFMDVRDIQPDILEGVDAIVHLAAISNDAMGKAHDRVTMEVNYRASVRLARMAKDEGVKSFVFASSCSTYGFSGEGPRTESSPLCPLTAYARSKVLTERALRYLADDAYTITCLRFATACGMSERLRLDLVLNDFVSAAITAGRIEILSDGKPWRPLIHVRDMARAIDWAIDRPAEPGGNFLIVNAGQNKFNYQIVDLAHAVRDHFPGVEVTVNENAAPDRRSYQVNFDLFRKLAPRHQPQMGLNETVAELKQGLENLGFEDRNFRNSHLIRLNVLSHLESGKFFRRSIRLRKNYV